MTIAEKEMTCTTIFFFFQAVTRNFATCHHRTHTSTLRRTAYCKKNCNKIIHLYKLTRKPSLLEIEKLFNLHDENDSDVICVMFWKIGGNEKMIRMEIFL